VKERQPSGKTSAAAELAARAKGLRLICLGLSALDQVWRVEGLFAGGSEKIRSFDHTTVGGGMAANAAVAASRLGGATAFGTGRRGRCGNTRCARRWRAKALTSAISGCFRRALSVSGIIVDRSGERQIANFRGEFPADAGWLPLDEIAGASAVLRRSALAGGPRSRCSAGRGSLGIPTVLDGDVADASVFEQLLPLTDHAVFSEPALAGFVGSASDEALARLSRFDCRVAAVTRGRPG